MFSFDVKTRCHYQQVKSYHAYDIMVTKGQKCIDDQVKLT